MLNPITYILRQATRTLEEPLNILTFCTHERYETGLAMTGHNFYAYRAQGIKDWNNNYGKCPQNYTLLDPNLKQGQIPTWIEFDLILSQNKFGQFQLAYPLAQKMNLPIVSLEHTLPMPQWTPQMREQLGNMRGKMNVFISEYSLGRWNWHSRNGDTTIIHHMVDTDVFTPIDPTHPQQLEDWEKQFEPRKSHILSVVNDWVNRDWCQPAGQKILTINGYKNIEDITIGDRVITDSGLYHNVTHTFKRKYCGKLIQITLDNNHKISFTPDHNIRMFRANKNNQWKYKASKNLKIGDKLRFPKHIQTDFTNTDTEYAWLIGLIIGDGHITKNGCIQIYFKLDDLRIAERAQVKLSEITNSNVNISDRRKKDGVYLLECSSKIFGNWLREKIYSNKQKIIPQFILDASQHIRISCLQGLFSADGSFKNGDRCSRFVYSSISQKLASQVNAILHSCDIKCSIKEEIRNTKIYRVTGYGKKNVNACEYIINSCIEDIENDFNGYEYTITNVELEPYDGYVYNCEVSNDPSYVVYPGFVAHNCCNFQGWQRITRGLPIRVVGDTPGLSKPAPSIEALVNEYRQSLIFLNTSTISPVPTALLEAMACGCSCVSTATCMIPEIIENGVNGFISNNEAELRKYCEILLEDNQFAKTLGYNATQTIKTKFNKERFLQQWDEVFRSVL